MTRIQLLFSLFFSDPFSTTFPNLMQVLVVLTRNNAIADPSINPATTSEQWFRYSETLLRPVRKAEQSVPKQSTGLAKRLDFVLIVLVMYI